MNIIRFIIEEAHNQMLDCKKLSNLINILNRHKIKGCLMGPGYN